MRVAGMMSGTSLDGIDVADVAIEGSAASTKTTARGGDRTTMQLLHFATVPFGPQLRSALIESLPPNRGSVDCVAELNFAMGEAFANALLQCAESWHVELAQFDLIGSHGHTLYHAPADGVTLQIGEAAVIAARTGVTCVADFRYADVAGCGQGAPLVPFVDRELFASDSEFRAVVNIGGIANITLLPRGASAQDVVAFDTGPGNMVIDECVRLLTGGTEEFDRGGRIAASAAVHSEVLRELLEHPYFRAPAPKSTGREHFGADFTRKIVGRSRALGLSPQDTIATATALSAQTIADAIPDACDRVIVSGGGARNAALMSMLRASLAKKSRSMLLESSDVHGVPVDAKEAMAFAMLAREAVLGRINHLPKCTGARQAAVLGKVTPGSNYARLMRALWASE